MSVAASLTKPDPLTAEECTNRIFQRLDKDNNGKVVSHCSFNGTDHFKHFWATLLCWKSTHIDWMVSITNTITNQHLFIIKYIFILCLGLTLVGLNDLVTYKFLRGVLLVLLFQKISKKPNVTSRDLKRPPIITKTIPMKSILTRDSSQVKTAHLFSFPLYFIAVISQEEFIEGALNDEWIREMLECDPNTVKMERPVKGQTVL